MISFNRLPTSEPEQSLNYYWSKRAMCRWIGYGIPLCGLALLMLKLSWLFMEGRREHWIPFVLGLVFGVMALGMLAISIYLIVPTAFKLLIISKSAFRLDASGLTFYKYGKKHLRWNEILSAQLIQAGESPSSTYLELQIKHSTNSLSIPTALLDHKADYLFADIERARAGGTPWSMVRPYEPNSVSKDHRLAYIFFSIVLLAYASWGLWIDDIYLPGKRGDGIHFHGAAALAMAAAMVCAAITFVIEVIDHYDRRNNEHWYDRFSCQATIAGWSLVVIGDVMR